MDDVKKLFQKIVNGQSAMKQEILKEIKKVDKKLSGRIDRLDKKTEAGFKEINKRLDNIGKSVAYLEDDTPTREEHDELEERVTKVEEKVLQA